jgi:protein-S-isoprenylcysteine O-methyltransferase Ste14
VPHIVLILSVLYFGLAFGWRTARQLRTTGSSGFRGLRADTSPAEYVTAVLFVVALVLGLVAPVLGAPGWLRPIEQLDHALLRILGSFAYIAGVALTLAAQVAMGASWRIGVDPAERSQLVTDGLFSYSRNPIFAAMLLAGAGLTLMLPNLAALVGLASLAVAVPTQVRLIEEPYLHRVHGDQYSEYTSGTGRFVPGIGKQGPNRMAE